MLPRLQSVKIHERQTKGNSITAKSKYNLQLKYKYKMQLSLIKLNSKVRTISLFKPCPRALRKLIWNFKPCEVMGTEIYLYVSVESKCLWTWSGFDFKIGEQSRSMTEVSVFTLNGNTEEKKMKLSEKTWILVDLSSHFPNVFRFFPDACRCFFRNSVCRVLLCFLSCPHVFCHGELYLRNCYIRKWLNVIWLASAEYTKWVKITS